VKRLLNCLDLLAEKLAMHPFVVASGDFPVKLRLYAIVRRRLKKPTLIPDAISSSRLQTRQMMAILFGIFDVYGGRNLSKIWLIGPRCPHPAVTSSCCVFDINLYRV